MKEPTDGCICKSCAAKRLLSHQKIPNAQICAYLTSLSALSCCRGPLPTMLGMESRDAHRKSINAQDVKGRKLEARIAELEKTFEIVKQNTSGFRERVKQLESTHKVVDNLVGSVFSINERVEKLEKSRPAASHGKYQKLVDVCKGFIRLTPTATMQDIDRALEELGVG